MSLQQSQRQTGYAQQPSLNYGGENALKLRLSTQKILLQIETDLKGEMLSTTTNDQGELITITVKVGAPKANPRGIQAILKFLRSCINTSSVQGNLNAEQYDKFIFFKRLELTTDLFYNLPDYEISEGDFNGIVNDCMSIIELVISRTIDNLERESYNQTIKHTETASVEQRRGILPI